MERFSMTFTKPIEATEVVTTIEQPKQESKGIHTLYVIPVFIDTNEVCMTSHKPSQWTNKEGNSWLTYFSGDFDSGEFNWDRVKGILEKYGFILRRSVKYDSMMPLFKSDKNGGTISACVLHLSFFDYDEKNEDRGDVYRIKKNSLHGDITFPDVFSAIVTTFVLK